jgi:hypothetical protein
MIGCGQLDEGTFVRVETTVSCGVIYGRGEALYRNGPWQTLKMLMATLFPSTLTDQTRYSSTRHLFSVRPYLSVMTAHISLNNRTFWAPPASRSAQFPRVHSQRHLATRSRRSVSRVSGQNALPTNDVMIISSDEDSDVTDTENDDDETDADDYLPSIAEIVSRLEKAERSRSNAAAALLQSQ